MADRWMDDRDREWRDRDWRRSEEFGRGFGRGGDDDYRAERAPRWDEARSWSGAAEDEGEHYEEQARHRYPYDQDEEDYRRRSGVTSGGGAYGAAGGYGGGESYGRSLGGGRPPAYQSGRGQTRPGQAARFTPQDYTGRDNADEAGRRDYGARQPYGGERDWRHEDERRGDWEFEHRPQQSRYARGDDRRFEQQRAYGRRDEERDEGRGGEGAGDFLQRAGERISSWFRGDHLMRGSREDENEPRSYREDFGREENVRFDRGHRGRGPKGYRRSDERINEEVHERLTDDPWLDASNIDVEVKDGEVTLSGHVDNREAKHRAERLIEDISGVGHVQNNLRVNPNAGLTGAGRGYGSSALEAEMRRNAAETDPGNKGASGLSGRTSTGALAERSSGTATEADVDPATGVKRK